MREIALAQLYELLDRFNTEPDPRVVLSRDALRLADEVWRSVDDPGSDLEMLHALGWLHWFRFQCLPEGQDKPELEAAAKLFGPVYLADPEAVPPALRRHLPAA